MVKSRRCRHEIERGGQLLRQDVAAGFLPQLLGQFIFDVCDLPLGRPEAFVRRHPPAVFLHDGLAQPDGIPFDHQIEIDAGAVEEQVPHESADDVQSRPLGLRQFGHYPQQRQAGCGEGGL
jgi:hypothetical protein